jgi:hypothetical protein
MSARREPFRRSAFRAQFSHDSPDLFIMPVIAENITEPRADETTRNQANGNPNGVMSVLVRPTHLL